MAKIVRPHQNGWQNSELVLTQYFSKFARENGLEVEKNPTAPYEAPVFGRDAYDLETKTKVYLGLILGKAPEHFLELTFDPSVLTERVIGVCTTLNIGHYALNGTPLMREGGKTFGWDSQGFSVEMGVFPDKDIQVIKFGSIGYNFKEIEEMGEYVPHFLEMVRKR